MAKEVFDQARPRNPKAQLFADAFEGCEEWVVPPRKRRAEAQSFYPAVTLPKQLPEWQMRRAA